MSKVVDAFKKDWSGRNKRTAEIITRLILEALALKVSKSIDSTADETRLNEQLLDKYRNKLETLEKRAHNEIRLLFKHNIFRYDLPPHSILHEDLLADKTWQILGLTQKQLLIAGTIGGAAIGAGFDVAALGHGLGLFTAIGSVAGALGALFGGEKLTDKVQLLGQSLGGEQVQIGPAKSMDLMFVLINRALLLYQHVINWAHGRRDYENKSRELEEKDQHPLTADWPAANIRICNNIFKSAKDGSEKVPADDLTRFRELIEQTLLDLSHRDY